MRQMVTRVGVEVPRRICEDLQTPTEAAISAAIQAVEQAPAHPRMTDAVRLLAQALDAVADAEEALNPSLATATPPTPPEQGDREFAICVWCNARVEWVASADRAEAEAKLREHSATCREHPAVKALALAPATPPTPDRAADSNNREMTDEEAERLFDLLERHAKAEPVSEERLARIREGVLRRLFPPTPDRAAVREALVRVLGVATADIDAYEALGAALGMDDPTPKRIADALLRPAPLPAKGEWNWHQGQLAESLIEQAEKVRHTSQSVSLSCENALMIGHALRALIAKDHARAKEAR